MRVGGARQDEQEIREAVQIPDDGGTDRLVACQTDDRALGATTHRPRQVQRSGLRRPARQDEVLERLEPRFVTVNGVLEGGDVRVADGRAAAGERLLQLEGIGSGELGPDREFVDALLQSIQRDLFTIGAELATPDPAKLQKALSRSGAAIAESDITALEDAIDSHEARLEPLKNFILPGGAPKAATLHLARTVCRRAERAVVALSRREQVSPAILRYLNRLSDLLFVLARAANAHAGRADVKW